MNKFFPAIFCFLLIIFDATNSFSATRPKNVILLIGDGMGLSQITYGMINNPDSNFEQFKTIGLVKTSAANSIITDSAASATAMATGVKTKNGYIGMDKDGNPQKTIVELAAKNGLSTGLVATSSIVHATPAAFAAHQTSRKMYEEIAADFLRGNVDVLIGGGLKYFKNRRDHVDLTKVLAKNGYEIYTNETSLFSDNYKGKIAAFLADDDLPKMQNNRGNLEARTADKAIGILADNKKGFFLMIEGSQIDWGGHQNDAEYIKQEVIDFDNVIGKVLEFAKKDGHTLVLVTADHETGGFALVSEKFENENYGEIQPKFSSGGHSAVMVPIFAYGPGAENFNGIYENTEIFWKIKKLLKI